jgi:hypothetical protein
MIRCSVIASANLAALGSFAVYKETQMYEAVTKVEEIFRKRGIEMEHPAPIPVEIGNRFN